MRTPILISILSLGLSATAWAVEVEAEPETVDLGEAQPSIVDEGEPTADERADPDGPALGFPLLTLLPPGALQPIRLEYAPDVVTLDEAKKNALRVVPTLLSRYPDATVVIVPPPRAKGETPVEAANDPTFVLRRDRVIQQLKAFGVADVRIALLEPAPSNPDRPLPIVLDEDHGPN